MLGKAWFVSHSSAYRYMSRLHFGKQIFSKTMIVSSPPVSIVIPTYQGERFLEETLASVRAQTYPALEIIISDDGSTDRTLEIVKDFQQQTALDCQVFTHEHLGMVDNWNCAVSRSRGKYIKFLLQDDLLDANCVSEMVELAESDREIGLVFSRRDLLLSEEAKTNDTCLAIVRQIENLHSGWSRLALVQSGRSLLSDPRFLEGCINKIGEPSTVLIRKEVFDTVGEFDPDLCQHVDIDMWCRIMLNYQVGFIDRTLSFFRVHLSQQTLQNQQSDRISTDLQLFLRKMMVDPCYSELPTCLTSAIYVKLKEERDDLLARNTTHQQRIQELEITESELQAERSKHLHLIEKISTELQKAQDVITGMESSKFWKIRTTWKQTKRVLRLPDND
jgi:glycosyltransferase involved in cell wall biosynthesis